MDYFNDIKEKILGPKFHYQADRLSKNPSPKANNHDSKVTETSNVLVKITRYPENADPSADKSHIHFLL